jgi:hypothetical protein
LSKAKDKRKRAKRITTTKAEPEFFYFIEFVVPSDIVKSAYHVISIDK